MRRITLILALMAVLALFSVSAGEQAEQLLRQSGVTGGLIVHVGCGDGRMTAALRPSDSYIVHGLSTDPAHVAKAREHIRSLGLYGPVSVDRWNGRRLPYVDNLVNLLVVEEPEEASRAELVRVLAPEGRLCVKEAEGKWSRQVKTRPAEMDEWTHYLHGSDGNAVSADTMVGPPRQFQWTAGPRYARHHDHMSSLSAMVSANGRLFSIFDYGSAQSILLPARWMLVARDAFNGTLLWQREMGPWWSHIQGLKSGPSNLPRRLVAVGDTVYVTLAIDAPVTALDAATGHTLRTYGQTESTDEILFSNGILFLVVSREGLGQGPSGQYPPDRRTVMAVRADTGETVWEREFASVVPGSLAVRDGRLALFDGERVVCLDARSGELRWESAKIGRRGPVPAYFSPCLVLYEGLLLFSGAEIGEESTYFTDNGKTMHCWSAKTGQKLWEAPHAPSGYRSAEDLLVAGGLVWNGDTYGMAGQHRATGQMWGRDPRTGELRITFMPDGKPYWFHHRCHRAKATENYLLTSQVGIEFIDFRRQHWEMHHWVRGACLYGIMPANGMVYSTPHPCACFGQAKLDGFNALAPVDPDRQAMLQKVKGEPRLERGPAYAEPPTGAETGEDWPTYRHDAARSGHTSETVPAELRPKWKRTLGGRLTPPVIAGGRLLVARPDAHAVTALGAGDGEHLWTFTAGGRVDSPPTVWKGRVLFGSADGCVYCLRARDGALVWRYRAAPMDLRLGAWNQLESVWPVHGSVLVRDGEVWCTAGRSMFTDGGLRLLRLDARTGQKIGETVMHNPSANSREGVAPVALSDLLVSDNGTVYMKTQPFDPQGRRITAGGNGENGADRERPMPHLFCPTGLLDDVWWHRSYWVYGGVWHSGAFGYFQAGRKMPSGQLLVFDETTVYGYGRKPRYYRWTTPMEYRVFAAPKDAPPVAMEDGGKRRMPDTRFKTDWTLDIPVLVRAMVLVKDTLLVAGAPDLVDENEAQHRLGNPETQQALAQQAAALEGSEGGLLWLISTEGHKLADTKLDGVPVFDGMAAAGGRLFLALADGQVVCLESVQSE